MEQIKSDNLTNENRSGAKANLPLRYLTATSIIGDNVVARDGDDMGEIKDLMVDLTSGKIEYFVVELGGFLGIGEKYYALPFAFLTVDAENKVFVLNQEEETIRNAPGFDKDHWPETNSHYYSNSTSYWGGFMGVNVGYSP